MAFAFGNIYGFSSWFNQARGPLSYLCLPARQTPILYDLHSDRTVNGVLDLLLCDFRVNEPLNRCLALSLEDSLAAFADLAKSTANNRVSVVAMHGGRVVGCRLSTIIQRREHSAETDADHGEPLGTLSPIWSVFNVLFHDVWTRGCLRTAQTVLKFEVVSVSDSFTRRGIALRLIELSIQRGREAGCDYVVVVATSYKTQRLFEERLGFQTAKTIDLKTFCFQNSFPFEHIPQENEAAKLMYKQISENHVLMCPLNTADEVELSFLQ